MYEVKNSCGHAGYAKYRFILEACKRAKLKFLKVGEEAKLKKEAATRAKLKRLSTSLGVGAITDVSQC